MNPGHPAGKGPVPSPQRKPLRKRRKGPDALLTAKLDTAWSQLIRSKGMCERCGRSDGVLHAHHIVGRRNHTTRWMLANGCCLCYRDHRWAHEEPLEFADWIRASRPKDVALLERVRNEISHPAQAEKRALLLHFRSRLDLDQAA